MKKLMTLAIALLIGTASTFAMDLNPTPKKEIRSQIIKLLDKSDYELVSEIKVNITFTFSSEGEIVVLSVDSKDADVLKYIRTNLNYKKIENPGERDKVYSMPLKVKGA